MIAWIKGLRDRFIEDCTQWWKLWSSWLAGLWGLIVVTFWNEPTLLSQVVTILPESTRAYLSPLVMLFVSGLPILIRVLKQRNIGPKQ
jgi:hypothetical protein